MTDDDESSTASDTTYHEETLHDENDINNEHLDAGGDDDDDDDYDHLYINNHDEVEDHDNLQQPLHHQGTKINFTKGSTTTDVARTIQSNNNNNSSSEVDRLQKECKAMVRLLKRFEGEEIKLQRQVEILAQEALRLGYQPHLLEPPVPKRRKTSILAAAASKKKEEQED